MNIDVIRTEHKLCTCCMEIHDVKVIHIPERANLKNVEVNFVAEYYYCDVADEYFADEAMLIRNDTFQKEAFRNEKGLLTVDDIKKIRSKYDISQKDLCILLGWGEKTVTRYESHQIQDRAHDSILKKLDRDPEWFLCLLRDSQMRFPIETYKKYYDRCLSLYETSQDMYLRKAIEAQYALYKNNESYNGKSELSLDKVVDVIRYFSNSSDVTNLYKVKLMKLMWYADFLAYKLLGHAITGLVYKALPMGAVPVAHDSIIDLKGVVYDEIEIGEGTAYRFTAQEDKIYFNLDLEEKNILDRVIEKLGKMTKDEIVSFMHNEPAYKETALRMIISYEYAQYIQI